MTLDNSDLFIWEYDMVNSLCINPDKAVRLYNMPKIIENYPESLYAMGHTPPETVEQIKEAKRRLWNGETGFSMVRRTIDAKGKSQWMKVDYSLEKDENGKPIRALMCGTDITVQNEQEAHYEEELRRKTTAAGDTKILCILDLTSDSIIENDAENPKLSDILKKENASVNEVMNSVCQNFVVPTDKETYMSHFSRENMQKDYENGVFHGSLRHQFVHLSGWYESAYDLLLNPSNGHIEAITTMKNVTELVRSEQIVNKIASSEFDAILTIDAETGNLHQFLANDLTGAGLDENCGIEKPEDYTEYLKKHCIPGDFERITEEMRDENVRKGLEKSVNYTVVYSLEIDGKIYRKRNLFTYLDPSRKTILCARQDITEIYRKEEEQKEILSKALKEAETANRAKSDFLARMSHDLRTPINAIVGLAALTMDDAKNAEMVRGNMTKMHSASVFMLNLVNDLLDMAKIEDHSVTLNLEPFTYSDFELRLKALFQPQCDEKNIKLTFENAPSNTTVLTDRRRLVQIFNNILSNAVKYTNVGGSISYGFGEHHVENGRLYCEYIIKDTGIGMSEEYQKHLFEPFAQEDNSITAELQGTGLGLSITKQLIELMGGHIEIESRKGEGTTVHIFMSFEIVELDTRKKASASDERSEDTEKLRGKLILLAEDHPLNAEIARRLLEKVGVIVVHADNGQKAVEMFKASKENEIDAVLMDIRMPIMSGFDAAKRIRELDREDAATVPIIAMSANAYSEDIEKGRACGMNGYLTKPVDPQKMYETLCKYCDSRKNSAEK